MTSDLRQPEFFSDGSVSYWSVYEQQWKRAENEIDIPDREYAAMPKADRIAILQHFVVAQFGFPCDDFK